MVVSSVCTCAFILSTHVHVCITFMGIICICTCTCVLTLYMYMYLCTKLMKKGKLVMEQQPANVDVMQILNIA